MTNRIQIGAFVGGLALIDAGFAWIYHPLGFIVGGGMLVTLAVMAGKRKQ